MDGESSDSDIERGETDGENEDDNEEKEGEK